MGLLLFVEYCVVYYVGDDFYYDVEDEDDEGDFEVFVVVECFECV